MGVLNSPSIPGVNKARGRLFLYDHRLARLTLYPTTSCSLSRDEPESGALLSTRAKPRKRLVQLQLRTGSKVLQLTP